MLPQGIFSVAVATVTFPTLARFAARQEMQNLRATMANGMRQILLLLDGSVFVVEIDQGITGLILLGNGTLRFRPTPETEQGQVRIFCGSETLEARFDALFLRVNPSDVNDLVEASRLRAALEQHLDD